MRHVCNIFTSLRAVILAFGVVSQKCGWLHTVHTHEWAAWHIWKSRVWCTSTCPHVAMPFISAFGVVSHTRGWVHTVHPYKCAASHIWICEAEHAIHVHCVYSSTSTWLIHICEAAHIWWFFHHISASHIWMSHVLVGEYTQCTHIKSPHMSRLTYMNESCMVIFFLSTCGHTLHCNTLQHTATHCNTLQTLSESLEQILARSRTHCNTLQHTATHCNTLQHVCVAV